MDIGGTSTRCRIVETDMHTGIVSADPFVVTQPINDRNDFFSFLRELVSARALQNRLACAALCFAGPITAQKQVYMTNWIGERTIHLDDLVACGLQADRIMILNDMEAAAHALEQHTSPGHNNNADFIPLYLPDTMVRPSIGNALLIMPGTGTGVSVLLRRLTAQGEPDTFVIACETQHAPIPALDAYHGKLLAESAWILAKPHLTWEDFVSGRGLETIYRAIVNLEHGDLHTHKQEYVDGEADRIAEMALAGTDDDCHAALAMYYRCAGALAQLLALTFRPDLGIYLAGNSTRNNLSYIPDSPFINALHDNPVHHTMLSNYPVYLVQSDLNLDGAQHLAVQFVRQNQQISLFV